MKQMKDTIYNILLQADGKFVSIDRIVDVININRTDTAQIVSGMIKGKTYPNIVRSHKRKTVGMGMKKRAVYNIRYKVPVNENK